MLTRALCLPDFDFFVFLDKRQTLRVNRGASGGVGIVSADKTSEAAFAARPASASALRTTRF